jgi:hypothetical protein
MHLLSSTPFVPTWKSETNDPIHFILHCFYIPFTLALCTFRPVQELRIADYIKAYTTTGRPPAPVPQEPADPTARASLELPLLFQPHIDLEKTSGGGTSTEQNSSSSQVNGLSQSQDSEVAGFEAITAEEPFKGYSFEVCFRWPLPYHTAFVGCPWVQSPIPKVTTPRFWN